MDRPDRVTLGVTLGREPRNPVEQERLLATPPENRQGTEQSRAPSMGEVLGLPPGQTEQG